MSSVEELTNLCSNLKKEHLKNNIVPELLNKIIAVYEGYLVAPDSYFSDAKIKIYFSEEFTSEIVQTISSLKKIDNNDVFSILILVYGSYQETL